MVPIWLDRNHGVAPVGWFNAVLVPATRHRGAGGSRGQRKCEQRGRLSRRFTGIAIGECLPSFRVAGMVSAPPKLVFEVAFFSHVTNLVHDCAEHNQTNVTGQHCTTPSVFYSMPPLYVCCRALFDATHHRDRHTTTTAVCCIILPQHTVNRAAC